MDPVSHVALGRILTKAFRPEGPLPRGTLAAAALGALSPDVDFVLMPLGWDVYLRAHEMGTHSLAGAAAIGLGSGILVRLLARDTPLRTLASAAVIGAFSHLAADIVSGARIRPLWPAADTVVTLPLVAMGDPWTIGILAGGGLLAWALGGARRHARLLLVVLSIFLTLKGVLLAVTLARAGMGVPPGWALGHVAEAQWGSLVAWRYFERTPGGVRAWRLDGRGSPPEILFATTNGPDGPLVDRSRSLSTVRNFLSVHAVPFATVRTEPGGLTSVLWSDARYCARADAPRRNEREKDTPPATAAGTELECALWFGGVFDREGRIIREQVRVGSWVQERIPDDAG